MTWNSILAPFRATYTAFLESSAVFCSSRTCVPVMLEGLTQMSKLIREPLRQAAESKVPEAVVMSNVWVPSTSTAYFSAAYRSAISSASRDRDHAQKSSTFPTRSEPMRPSVRVVNAEQAILPAETPPT